MSTETQRLRLQFPYELDDQLSQYLSPEGEAPGLLRGFLIGIGSRGTIVVEDLAYAGVGRVVELGVVVRLGAEVLSLDSDFSETDRGVVFELFEPELTVDGVSGLLTL